MYYPPFIPSSGGFVTHERSAAIGAAAAVTVPNRTVIRIRSAAIGATAGVVASQDQVHVKSAAIASVGGIVSAQHAIRPRSAAISATALIAAARQLELRRAVVFSATALLATSGFTVVPAADTFNRANGPLGTADSGHVWTAHVGTWAITSNQAGASGAAGANASVDLGTTDQVVEVDVVHASAQQLVAARFTAGTSYYIAGFQAGDNLLRLWAYDGSYTNLVSVDVGVHTGRVRLSVIGTAIKVYLDGVEKINTTDSRVTAGTRAGLYTGSTATNIFDNFNEVVAETHERSASIDATVLLASSQDQVHVRNVAVSATALIAAARQFEARRAVAVGATAGIVSSAIVFKLFERAAAIAATAGISSDQLHIHVKRALLAATVTLSVSDFMLVLQRAAAIGAEVLINVNAENLTEVFVFEDDEWQFKGTMRLFRRPTGRYSGTGNEPAAAPVPGRAARLAKWNAEGSAHE